MYMVAPVAGPIIKVTPSVDNRDYYKQQLIYRQARPYNLALKYRLVESWANSGTANDNLRFNAVGFDATGGGDGANAALSACYEKFRGAISDSAGIGVDLAEYHQSVDMITSAATKVRNIAIDIRRRDFGKVLRELDPRGVHKDISWSKSFANNFLQVHFGWEPLMADMHDATQVISNPLKNTHATAKAHNSWSHDSSFDMAPYGHWNEVTSGIVVVKMGADVSVSNPNLHLADQLGLINPASLVWETIPFSFVVDWFANVGQFVGQMTDFAGLTLSRAYTNHFYKAIWNAEVKYVFWTTQQQNADGAGVCLVREDGIASVPLTLRPLKLPSVTRAATAISLLIQSLGR
jgi:hypothetical protein